MGTCGRGNGAEGVYHAFAEQIDRAGADVSLASVGCFGPCSQEPLVTVRLPGRPLVVLHRVQASDVTRILHDVATGNVTPDLVYCKIEEWDHITSHIKYGHGWPELRNWDEVPFFRGQKKIVMRNCGFIDPDDLEEYIGIGGYQALYKVLIEGHPEEVIEQIKASKLRGRGGAGYPDRKQVGVPGQDQGGQKYIICNADEGDPGAYMNRNEIESDPHSLIEGMIIGAYVMGATEGIVYVRAEYPLAVHRLERAIEQAREYGMLGENILGRGFQFDISTGGRRGSLRLRRRDGADCVARRHGGTAAAASAVSGAEGVVGQANQHQQRRDVVQHRAHRHQRRRMVHRDRQHEKRGDQGVFAGRQGDQLGTGGIAAGHAAEDAGLRHRRGRRERHSRSRPCRPAGHRAVAFRRRCSTPRWITKAWRRSVPSWGRAAWW